ncbi:MAG: flagellar export chaperone FliS [Saccharospirillaceae bacterium]|nr:flagellar export chaperone FliS [Pseudomonadales bacterium]NRB80446.1 flagellar export chaperone FliS [Saccharospirillaceae bacterium]
MYSNGAKQYQQMSAHTAVMDADPHRLIQLLFEGALTRIAKAKGHVERNEIEARNETINAAIRIVGGLQESLDMNAGEIAQNLDNLYDYMIRRLFEANSKNSNVMLDEVAKLLIEIKSAWDEIREDSLIQHNKKSKQKVQ